jgi:hypothetical protein
MRTTGTATDGFNNATDRVFANAEGDPSTCTAVPARTRGNHRQTCVYGPARGVHAPGVTADKRDSLSFGLGDFWVTFLRETVQNRAE